MIELIHFLTAFSASVVGAISGIGGGIIIKPLLDTVGYFEIATITFLSGCTVLAMSGFSLLLIRKTKISINKKIGGVLAVSGIAGGLSGKYLFNLLLMNIEKMQNIQLIQASILIALSAGVFIFTLFKGKITPHRLSNIFVCLIIGFALGFTGAYLGIGGGPVNLLVLYFFFSMEPKTAAINSLFIIFFSQLASFLLSLVSGKIPSFPLPVLLLMMFGGISGAFLGANISKRLSNRSIDKLFMTVLVIIIILCFSIIQRQTAFLQSNINFQFTS